DTPAVADLAMRYGLSAYDAAYLWLAADLKCPLATFDDKLAAAARTHLAGLA
ncbi:MAG: type II toxin-antitoxin system VapC family toxin, partial [Polaromonas sp.]|nr:type II toxin-antitoxin system VapC family toxin [Polaromonas sp.]